LLNAADLARFTGRDGRTVQKIFAFKNNYISKAEVARTIS
jgi:hypothetical protein